MSRTDKDMPSWVRANWYEPYHRCGWYRVRIWNKELKRYTRKEWEFRGECDLPRDPIIGESGWSRPRRKRTGCVWEAEWTDTQVRYRKNKREWRRSEFYGPMRMKERAASRRIISGDITTEYPDARTRHSVLWNME